MARPRPDAARRDPAGPPPPLVAGCTRGFLRAPPKAAALLAAAAVLSQVALAQTGTVELKWASAAPPTSPWAKQINRTAATVLEESQGRVKVVPFFASQLGSENDTIAQVARGRIEAGSFTLNSVALQLPELALLQLPMYYASTAQRDCVLDNHAERYVAEALDRKGLKFLGWGEVGAGHLPGKKAYVTLADVRGIKVGVVTNKVWNAFWSFVGANPVPTTVAEATSSMQTGLIDTFPSPYAFYVPSGLHKVAPVMVKFPLMDAVGLYLMNKAAWEKLPPEGRAAFEKDRAKHDAALQRREIRSVDSELTVVHKQAGGTVVEATDEQREQWRRALVAFWPAAAKELGPEGERLFALMEAGKRACEGAR